MGAGAQGIPGNQSQQGSPSLKRALSFVVLDEAVLLHDKDGLTTSCAEAVGLLTNSPYPLYWALEEQATGELATGDLTKIPYIGLGGLPEDSMATQKREGLYDFLALEVTGRAVVFTLDEDMRTPDAIFWSVDAHRGISREDVEGAFRLL